MKVKTENVRSVPIGSTISFTCDTPKGVNISKQGLKPDVEIILENQKAENANDNQLDEAIKLLYDGR